MSVESCVLQGGEPEVSTEKHENLAYKNMAETKYPPRTPSHHPD